MNHPLGGKNTLQDKIFQLFLRYLSPKANVLDLGCGAGTHLKLVLEGNPSRKVTGIDLCPEMIKTARQSVPKGTFACRDLRTFKFPESTYDAVILASVINHLKAEELEKLVVDVAYTIKPDGLLFMNFWSGEYSGFKCLDFADRPMLVNYYDCLYILNLMRDHNFGSLKVKRFHQQLETSAGSETIQDCYYFGHMLKEVDMNLRLKSAVTEPMIFYAPNKRRDPDKAEAKKAGQTSKSKMDQEFDFDTAEDENKDLLE